MSAPTQSDIEIGLGPLVTGVMIQQLFFGILLSQASQYFNRYFSKDMIFCQVVVGLLVFFNVLLGVLDFHVIYRATVLYYGNFDRFDLQEWTMWAEPGVTTIIGAICQVFFVVRCWQFARSRVILFGLILLTMFAFGGGLSVSISFWKVKRFSKLALIPTQITVWLVSTSVCDIAISSALIFYIVRNKSPVKSTQGILSRLMRQSMETSSVTAICATLNFVFYKALGSTAYHLLPQFAMARVYSMTVLYTLLGRHDLRQILDSNTNSFATTFTKAQSKMAFVKNNRQDIEISVAQQTIDDKFDETTTAGPHDIHLGNMTTGKRSEDNSSGAGVAV